MPRFVILTHDHPHWHWDLLLERPGQELLQTWRLEQPPSPGIIIQAEALPDHRRLYLDYEGPISGNRGKVARWDSGEFSELSRTPTQIALRFQGHRLDGIATLIFGEENAWTLQFDPGS